MKLILIIFPSPLEETVMKALKDAGAAGYTKLPYLLGEGGHSDPHLDNYIWPGFNQGLVVVVDETTKEKVMQAVREIRAAYLKEGVKAFVLPVEESI